jgi:hypothetical protein
VGAKQELILIDTNIFVIDLRYKRDKSYKLNQSFFPFRILLKKPLHNFQIALEL